MIDSDAQGWAAVGVICLFLIYGFHIGFSNHRKRKK